MKSEEQTNVFLDKKVLIPEKKNVVKMKHLLEKFPELRFQKLFFPVLKDNNNNSHTCESIHDLAYNDLPFLSPLLLSAFMVLLNKPISVYILENGDLQDLTHTSTNTEGLKIKESDYISAIIESLFGSKTPNDAFVIGEYKKIPEKRIGVLNLERYKKNKSIKLLENISFTKTNWGSFAFIQGQTINKRKKERYTLVLKYKLINLLSESFGFNGIHEVCPRVAAAAATLQYSLDVSTGLSKDYDKIKSSKEEVTQSFSSKPKESKRRVYGESKFKGNIDNLLCFKN